MPGLREAGLLGASAALTGGLAYVVWSFLSSGAKEPKPGRETVKAESDPATGKAETRGEPVTGSVAVAAAAPDVSSAQNASITKSSLVEKGKQVLVLGLDGAGKTSLLHCLTTASQEQDVEPTQGFNAVSINREDLQIEFLEIGGKENLRCYWQRYIPKALVLVFVVDSSKAELFSQAKKHLHELVASDPHLPLVVLANKQDLPGACSITELHDGLSLTEVGDQRKLFLIGTYVRKGDTELSSGVQDARELIIQMTPDGVQFQPDARKGVAHYVVDGTLSNAAEMTGGHRILELALHKKSRTVWATTPCEKVTWGNQEPIWPISPSALGAAPTERIQHLARHKRDFSARDDGWRKEEETKSSRKTLRPSSQASQLAHIVRLSAPKSRGCSSRAAGPPHTPQCEYNCPLWHVDPRVRSADITPRLLQLSIPKQDHPDHLIHREDTYISLNSKKVGTSPRLLQLSLPKLKESSVCRELGPPEVSIWTVSKVAKRATASPCVIILATSKDLAKDYIPPRDPAWSRQSLRLP